MMRKGSGTGRSPLAATDGGRRPVPAVPCGFSAYFPFFAIAWATSFWIEAASLETCSAFALAPL